MLENNVIEWIVDRDPNRGWITILPQTVDNIPRAREGAKEHEKINPYRYADMKCICII